MSLSASYGFNLIVGMANAAFTYLGILNHSQWGALNAAALVWCMIDATRAK